MVLALISPHATVSAASGCTNATITGAYGLTATGAIFAPNGARSDIALLGRTIYDGQGGLSGAQIDSIVGTLEHDTLTGTYTHSTRLHGRGDVHLQPQWRGVHADFVVSRRATRSCSSTPIPGSC